MFNVKDLVADTLSGLVYNDMRSAA